MQRLESEKRLKGEKEEIETEGKKLEKIGKKK